MAISKHMLKVLAGQEELVLQIDDNRITQLAKRIAFYSAMIDAALDDPLDDPTDQDEILEILKNTHTEHVETYQILVNEYL